MRIWSLIITVLVFFFVLSDCLKEEEKNGGTTEGAGALLGINYISLMANALYWIHVATSPLMGGCDQFLVILLFCIIIAPLPCLERRLFQSCWGINPQRSRGVNNAVYGFFCCWCCCRLPKEFHLTRFLRHRKNVARQVTSHLQTIQPTLPTGRFRNKNYRRWKTKLTNDKLHVATNAIKIPDRQNTNRLQSQLFIRLRNANKPKSLVRDFNVCADKFSLFY